MYNNGSDASDSQSVTMGLINRIFFVAVVLITAIMVTIQLTTKVKELKRLKMWYISLLLQIICSLTSFCTISLQRLVLIRNKFGMWVSVTRLPPYLTRSRSVITTWNISYATDTFSQSHSHRKKMVSHVIQKSSEEVSQ